MTAGTKLRHLIAVTVVAGLFWGCSNDNKNSATASAHSEDWVSKHGEAVVAGDIGCTQCHGDGLQGGSALACAECHGADGSALAGNPDLAALEFSETNGKPLIDHPSGFAESAVIDDTIPFYPFEAHRHGYIAKAGDGALEAPVGFRFCSDCHTPAFTGAPLPTPPFPGSSADCLGCHGNGTPHGRNLDAWGPPGYHHITTNPENADVCGQCHTGGADRDTSVANRCFNGTLCHTGAVVTTPIVSHYEGHWDFHKQNPRACQICHGEDHRGRGEAPACFLCHNGKTEAPLCTICHEASVITPAATSTARRPFRR